MTLFTIKRNLESRMLGNSHVRFGVGGGVQLPALHHGTNDPTAHAEIVAIRRASAKLGRFDLSDCTLYSTCEPCPMCLSAIHRAGIRTLYFGADRHDAAGGGFDDEFIYQLMEGTADSPLLRPVIVDREECADLFNEWNAKSDRTMY